MFLENDNDGVLHRCGREAAVCDGENVALDGDVDVIIDVDPPFDDEDVDMEGGMGDSDNGNAHNSLPEVRSLLIDRRRSAGILRTVSTWWNLTLPRCFPSISYSFRIVSTALPSS